MKILYIASSSGWGGGSVALFNLIKGLKDRGHALMVLFPNGGDKRFCEELDQINIKYSFANYGLTIYPRTRNPFKYIVRLCRVVIQQRKAQHKVYGLINSYKPDIVHTNVGPLDIALTPCRKCHVPHIWHLREYQDKDFGMVFMPSKSSFIRRVHQNGNYNIAITKGVFSYWSLNPAKDVVIYDGVFSENDGAVSCPKEDIILFAGRIETAKGVCDLFEPFSNLLKLHPGYKLILAGKYQKRSKYYQQCMRLIKQLNIDKSVVFLGEVSNVYEWMAKARALVVPSRFEGFGFITAEAMLNGCFVVGRNTAGTKDQFDKCLEETGVECAYRFTNTMELYEGLKFAVENDTSEQCKQAQLVVMDNYTQEKHCSKVEEFYNKVKSLYV